MIQELASTLQQHESFKKAAFRLAAGLVLAGAVLGGSVIFATRLFTLSKHSFMVKGTAEKTVQADRAVWRGSFSVRNADYLQTVIRLEADRALVRRFLLEQGFDSASVSFQAVNTYPQYKTLPNGMQTAAVEYWVSEQTVEVVSGAVGRVERLAQQVEPLLRQGVMFVSFQPEFYVSGIEDIKLELLGQASANARLRADRLAEEGGTRAGRLMSSRQGVFQITAPNATDDDGYGLYDTRTIEKRVRIVVTNEYAAAD